MAPRREVAARRLLEWLVWPEGRRRAHCDGKTSWPPNGGRPGLYECAGCHRQFTVTTRTPLHATKLPIATWLEAASPVLASSKGVSSLGLARHLGITQRSARTLEHALQLMMRPGAYEPPLGGIVEVDDLPDGGNPARRNRVRYGRAMASTSTTRRGERHGRCASGDPDGLARRGGGRSGCLRSEPRRRALCCDLAGAMPTWATQDRYPHRNPSRRLGAFEEGRASTH